jgi:chemotaxis protein histidine kinase CheA
VPRIAISYRRGDSSAITGRIFDRLADRYGRDSVFRDIDNIPLGVDFREYIDGMLKKTDVTLVVIGRRWLGATRGRRRIDDPADPVRVEVETALRNCRHVIPVVVEGGSIPKVEQLPDSLNKLPYRAGLMVDSGQDFEQHIERLIRNIQSILQRQAEEDRESVVAEARAEAERRAEEERQQAEAARRVEEERQQAEAERRAEEERQRAAEAERRAEEERQRAAEAERRAEAERQQAEAARRAEEERQQAEAERRAEEKRQRAAEAERRAEEERQQADAARRAEAERQQAEAARRAEAERQQAEAARRAEQELQQAEAARRAQEERQRATAAQLAEIEPQLGQDQPAEHHPGATRNAVPRVVLLFVAAGVLAVLGYFIVRPSEAPVPQPATGVLAFHGTPPGATVLLDGNPINAPDGFRQVIKSGLHEIEARADGYQSWRETVTVPAGGEKSLELALVKPPPAPPPTGTLALRVSPADVVLTLDGKPVGSAANFREEIPAGTHELGFSADGYQSRSETVTVPAGGEKSFELALVKPPSPVPPPPTTGMLSLRVSPPEAALTLDSKPAGSAADFRQEVTAGSHKLELSAEGYQNRHETVTVPAGGEKDMELALVKPPPPLPPTGRLELEVSPANAMLKLDGAWVGSADGFRRELPAGKHPAEIAAAGYRAQVGELKVEAGETTHLHFDLAALPPPRPVLPKPAPPIAPPGSRPRPEPTEPPSYRERMPAATPKMPRSAPQYTAPALAAPVYRAPPAVASPQPAPPASAPTMRMPMPPP